MTTPPEDLVIAARMLDRRALDLVQNTEWADDADDWRVFIAPPLRRVWGRIGFEARLAAYVVAETATRARDD